MILATFLPKGKTYRFPDVEAASAHTRLTAGRIRRCIESGGRWCGWTFDEA